MAKKLFKSFLSLLLVITIVCSITPRTSYAAAADFQKAQISFTFDDGFESLYTNALPIFNAAGFKGTLYYITGLGDGTVNNGMTDDDKPGMTWAQVVALQNTYGWEIGSHTVTHTPLSTLTTAQLQSELVNSRNILISHGINPVTTFAFPEGDYVNATLVETVKDYAVSRGFQDVGLNTFPYNKAVLVDQSLDKNLTLAQAEAFVDQAIANKQWLIFSGHGIDATSNPNYDYIWTTANLQALVTYIKNKNVPVVKVADAIGDPGPNLTTNSSFEQPTTTPGVIPGWTNDNATQVTVDKNNNGSYAVPTSSIKMTGGTSGAHLFSSLIDAIPGADYLLQSFVNTLGLTGGEFGFYMDEYDSAGNWISGQWLGLVANNTIGFFSKVYHATSDLVAKLSIQEYLTAGATGTVYTDNVNLFNLSASASATPTVTPVATITATLTPTSTPSGTVTPTTAPTTAPNMIANNTFDSGISNGWTTDNATQTTADSANHGGAPTGTNSVKFTGGSAAAHLFYGLVTIDPTISYLLSIYDDATGLTGGELGYYMDEYNSAGTWISGQWLGKVTNGVISTFSRIYKASSTLVSSVRVQTYLTAGSTGNAYVDNFSLTAQITPSVTPTGTVTPTSTPSATPTTSVTPTASPTASVTPSVTPTGTITPTATPTITPTVTTTPIPTPTPTGTVTNLVQNSSFETLTSGWANNWTRDTTDFTVDTTTKGNNGANSLHIGSNVNYAHAFSELIAIDASKTYNWTQYLSLLSGSGEFGFYIDEYDASGNWISGQWKGMVSAAFTGSKQFTYTPTSTNVAKIRLQYYTVPSSTFNLFLDSVSLTAN